MWTKTIAMSLFVCLINALAAAQGTYTVTDLGPLAPTAINSWAQVVGNYNQQAYLWSFGQTIPLGKLPGGTLSSAAAINDLGVVAGTADGRGTVTSFRGTPETVKCSDLTQPFVWTQKNGMKKLGTVGDPNYIEAWCDLPFDASGINDFNQVVGYLAGSYNNTQWGFAYTDANGMSVYGGSWVPTFANGVNNVGQIAGQNGNGTDYGHATVWSHGLSSDLGTLGGGESVMDYASSANGINDLGVAVGWSTTSPVEGPAGPDVHAVIWTASGISDLGTLPGDTSSAALKINYFGQVIGTSGAGLYPPLFALGQNTPFQVTGRPFLWTQAAGMQDLNSLLPTNSGWVLDSVSDINIWGQIVGSGKHNGKTRGFLLTPNDL